MTPPAGWDLEFSSDTKTLTVARQQRVPGGGGYPYCYQCGEPIMMRPDFHHRKRKAKGGGDGRPSNCIATHNRIEGEQCHFRMIHQQPAAARANGWIILASAPAPRCYRMPLLVAWLPPGIDAGRPWIVLDDQGGFRQATERNLRGEYDRAR